MRRTAFAALTCVSATLSFGATAAGGCGGSLPVADATDAADRLDGAIVVDASCLVTIESPPLLPGTHVSIGSEVQYDSNPPSSGPHYPVWAAYQAYDAPVPRPYYVHDLEHGAIVFLYKCDKPGGCPDVAAALKKASDALPDDPICAGTDVRVRTVITPDPLLDVPVAAAAWGWIYKAACVDLPSLTQFAKDHYARAPEQACGNGTTSF